MDRIYEKLLILQRREPTAEEREHMRFYDHPGMIHPGIRTHDPSRNRKQYYVFYQWVCFVLFLQGVSFFLPRFIWRTFVVKDDLSKIKLSFH